MFHIAETFRSLGHQVLTVATTDERISTPRQNPADFPLLLFSRPHPLLSLFRALRDRLPLSVAKYSTPNFLSHIMDLIADYRPDVIWVDHAQLGLIAEKVQGLGSYLTLVRAHNLEWKIFERSADASSNLFRRALLRFEAIRMKRFEANLPGKVDGVVCISALERDWFCNNKPNGPSRISNIYLMPAGYSGHTRKLNPLHQQKRVLHVAPLDWAPNADGLRWLLQEVWPIVQAHIPDAVLNIVGRNPPADLIRTYASPAAKFHGFVEDILPFEEEAQCLVVPLHVGGGIRIKLLNAFARGIPVVTTNIGCEGLPVTDGTHAFVADEPEAFAAYIIRCLEADPFVHSMRERAYELVTKQMSWPHLMQSLLASLGLPKKD